MSWGERGKSETNISVYCNQQTAPVRQLIDRNEFMPTKQKDFARPDLSVIGH